MTAGCDTRSQRRIVVLIDALDFPVASWMRSLSSAFLHAAPRAVNRIVLKSCLGVVRCSLASLSWLLKGKRSRGSSVPFLLENDCA